MNFLGTTGTRSIGDRSHDLITYMTSDEMSLYLDSFDGFVSGGCRGWDALFGYGMANRYGAKKTHVVVLPTNRSQVIRWWEDFDLGLVKIIEMPEGTDYSERNQKIVDLSSRLFYCAEHPEDHGASRRSGTWQTVRMARRKNLAVDGITLNG